MKEFIAKHSGLVRGLTAGALLATAGAVGHSNLSSNADAQATVLIIPSCGMGSSFLDCNLLKLGGLLNAIHDEVAQNPDAIPTNDCGMGSTKLNCDLAALPPLLNQINAAEKEQGIIFDSTTLPSDALIVPSNGMGSSSLDRDLLSLGVLLNDIDTGIKQSPDAIIVPSCGMGSNKLDCDVAKLPGALNQINEDSKTYNLSATS